MSYDLAVWEGHVPDSDEAASRTFGELMEHWQEADRAAPTPSIVSYVELLLQRWPDITSREGDDSPWADGPLINNASGPIIYFSISWSRAEETVAYAADLAAAHGLVCFDPQAGIVRL